MIKLREIIQHLDEDLFLKLKQALKKTKADNFLFLLETYRENKKDSEVIESLNINSNSFYVLKSRLYDKIQELLSGDIYISGEELLKKLHSIPEICVRETREVATAFLQKLEADLSRFDMHNELLLVYSALKKLHLYSDKYFHYSQLYNKHIAFSLSLEKSEETLGNFNRALCRYYFSGTTDLRETLEFLKREVNDHITLNPSRQVEIIRNIIDLQLAINSRQTQGAEFNIDQLLSQTEKLISELPPSSPQQTWLPVLHYLAFEYNFKISQYTTAATYYNKLQESEKYILLYSNIAVTGKYFLSKIRYLQQTANVAELKTADTKSVLLDKDDMYSNVTFGLYVSVCLFYAGKTKEAANKLNHLLNEYSFKDYFLIQADVRLTLAWYYINMREYDLAESMIKGVYRKIKTEKIEGCANILDIIKVFEADIKSNGESVTEKQSDHFTLFAARNKKYNTILSHLEIELEKRYNK